MSLRKRLKEARLEADLTQEEAATSRTDGTAQRPRI